MPRPKTLNEIILFKDHAEIIIKRFYNKSTRYAPIDLEDVEKIKDLRWYHCEGHCPKHVTKIKSIILSRYILGITNNDTLVDHKDGDWLNNRKSNLRIANKSTNAMNSKRRIDNNSGTRGISWSKEKKKWHVYITLNKKRKFIGYFSNRNEAINQRIKYENKLFGEFRRI